MANVLYPKFKEKLLNPGTAGINSGAQVDMDSDNIRVALIDTGVYTYNASHEFLSSASGATVGTAQLLGSKTVTNGVFDAGDVTFTGLTGNSVEAYIIYKDTGTASSSPLIAYFDSATSGLPLTPNGGNVTIQFNASGIFAL
jgi:hypothetical protein